MVAAVIVSCAVLYATRRAGKRALAERDQRERQHEEGRENAQRAEALARCWDQWWQVVDTAALEPAVSEGATLGLGPEVTLELLRGLLRDAELPQRRAGTGTLERCDPFVDPAVAARNPMSVLLRPLAPRTAAERLSCIMPRELPIRIEATGLPSVNP